LPLAASRDTMQRKRILRMKGVSVMAREMDPTKISVYIPQTKQEQHLVERLIKLGAARDRSVNYLVVIAIEQFVDREEKKGA